MVSFPSIHFFFSCWLRCEERQNIVREIPVSGLEILDTEESSPFLLGSVELVLLYRPCLFRMLKRPVPYILILLHSNPCLFGRRVNSRTCLTPLLYTSSPLSNGSCFSQYCRISNSIGRKSSGVPSSFLDDSIPQYLFISWLTTIYAIANSIAAELDQIQVRSVRYGILQSNSAGIGGLLTVGYPSFVKDFVALCVLTLSSNRVKSRGRV